MSLTNFIPQLWSDMCLAQLRKNMVAAALCNRDYEGQIRQMGDTVRINAIGDVTISTYVKDTPISTPQVLTDAQTMLTITQAQYYNFAIDDVDKAQTQPKVMGEAMSWASYRLADQVDQFVIAHYTDAGALVGSSGSFVTVTTPTQTNIGGGTTVYDELIQLGQLMTQNLCPKQNRWAIVPPWVSSFLAMDLRFTSFNTADAQARLASGAYLPSPGSAQANLSDSTELAPTAPNHDALIGRIAGFDIWESVNAPHLGGTSGIAGSQDVIFAGHSMGISFALGLSEVEAYRHPNYFNDAVKGLALYGVRSVRPACLGAAYLQHP